MSLKTHRAASTHPTEPQAGFEADLARGRWDIAFFAKRFLGITGHAGQVRLWAAALRRDRTGVSPAFLTIDCSAGNRAGKTLGLAILVFHNAFYKMGLDIPSRFDDRALERWLTAAYEWYHFAIQQETSELVYYEIVRMLSGIHEAQPAGCPIAEELGQPPATWDKKYRGEYLWIRIDPVFGGADIHFRTTSEKAIGSLGKDMHGISFDECAFDANFDFIIEEVLHLRRLSTGGQLFLISTPTEGINAFSDHWERGNPARVDRWPDHWSVRMSTRENIGFGIKQEMFDRLVAGMPEHLVPQNIDGLFLEGRKAFFDSRSVDQSFVEGLEEHLPPVPGHSYVQGVDPAISFDSTWSLVIDRTDSALGVGVRASRKSGRQTALGVSALVQEAHHAYNAGGATCTTAIDATGFGGKVFRDLLGSLDPPVRSVEFGGTRGRKLKLLTDLKAAIERGQLRFPRSGTWLALRRQLLGYRLDDKRLETDAVMALAVAVSQMQLFPAGGSASAPFDYFTGGADNGVSSQRPSWLPRRAVVSSLSGKD